MFRPRVRQFLFAAGAFALALVGAQLVAMAPASADPAPQMATVYYSASSYQSETNQAASIWNGAVANLNMVENAGSASITVAGTTGGGSRAYPCGLGCATIYIDSQDVAAGHNALRIVSHEIGHGHTLPDNYNGDCNLLMSGGSAGTGCTNPNPSSGEASQVNAAYGGGFVIDADLEPSVYDPSLV